MCCQSRVLQKHLAPCSRIIHQVISKHFYRARDFLGTAEGNRREKTSRGDSRFCYKGEELVIRSERCRSRDEQ